MKVKELIILLTEHDMDAEVKPYFLVDIENIDTSMSEFECYGDVVDIELNAHDANVVYLNSEL